MKVDLLHLNNVKKAFIIANNAIYFKDKSGYLRALYEICHVLNPTLDFDEFGTKCIEE